jgi:aspartokinase-like uncharacterized kinase
MWVVKIGGSLQGDVWLPQWLDMLATVGGGRVTLVCGGGVFADQVRRAQAQWQFGDLPAHNMAVLAMAQTAYLVHGLQPSLRLVRSVPEIRQVMQAGQTALWLPMEWLREGPSPDATWDVTSDSMALDLASRLNAERLVVVKACNVDPAADLGALGAAGIVDLRFAPMASGVSFPIDVVQRDHLSRMRSLLIGELREPAR